MSSKKVKSSHLIRVLFAATGHFTDKTERLHLIEPFLKLVVLVKKLFKGYISAQIVLVVLEELRSRILKKWMEYIYIFTLSNFFLNIIYYFLLDTSQLGLCPSNTRSALEMRRKICRPTFRCSTTIDAKWDHCSTDLWTILSLNLIRKIKNILK